MKEVKQIVMKALRRWPSLYAMASKSYYAVNRSFFNASPGGPYAIQEAFKKMKQLTNGSMGDYYEFGLFRGYTLWFAYQTAKKLAVEDTCFYGFDSFQGMPEAEGIDRTYQFYKGQFSCSKNQVETFLTKKKIDWSRVELIEGFYKDTLTEELRKQYPFRPASVLFLDCDYYSSTVEVLNWVQPLIKERVIILFDDWYTYGGTEDSGQPKAFKEFLEVHPHIKAELFLEFPRNGKAFLLRFEKAGSDR